MQTICIEEKWMDGWLFDYLRTLIIKPSNNRGSTKFNSNLTKYKDTILVSSNSVL